MFLRYVGICSQGCMRDEDISFYGIKYSSLPHAPYLIDDFAHGVLYALYVAKRRAVRKGKHNSRVGKNHIHTPYMMVYDCIFGDFPAKNIIYIPYTYGSGQP